MKNPAVAKRYAEALFDVANAQGQVDTVEQELAAVANAINEYPQLQHILTHPSITLDVKKKQFVDLFGGRVSAIVLNFMQLLFDQRRQENIEDIYKEFVRRVDKALGRVKAHVQSAVPLTEEELNTLKNKIATGGQQVSFITEVNPNLIGGVRVRVGDRVYDYSVAAQLDRFRQALKY